MKKICFCNFLSFLCQKILHEIVFLSSFLKLIKDLWKKNNKKFCFVENRVYFYQSFNKCIIYVLKMLKCLRFFAKKYITAKNWRQKQEKTDLIYKTSINNLIN